MPVQVLAQAMVQIQLVEQVPVQEPEQVLVPVRELVQVTQQRQELVLRSPLVIGLTQRQCRERHARVWLKPVRQPFGLARSSPALLLRIG